MTQPTALIVDDEPDICELLEITLMRMGIDAHSVFDLSSARNLLVEIPFDLCLTDMRLPDGNGIDLVRHINQHYPKLPVAMITAHGNMESAIEALKAGAFDFVSKPVDLEVLRKLVQQAIKLGKGEESPPSNKHAGSGDQSPMLGNSPPMQKVRQLIDKLSRSQAPVYISGESGTGKELAARLIHHQGPRADHPFVAVNCGAIPQELMESELFGHTKGSFTGAIQDHQGLFQSADGGTLFLDEIADLPLHMQVKLLRAIQEKRVRPIGGQQELPIDVRIICATHKNLRQLVETGDFRQDLYYRINVIELPLPPLRERTEDIPLLAQHILTLIARASGNQKSKLSASAMKKLKCYAFPGNIRELENILERSIT
ncbi:MAG: sigma-54 dependent transcriptional regulator, partial [Candidatus Thiodiazotropha sp.]